MSKKRNRTYDQEFKNTMVELYKTGKSVTELHNEYGIPLTTIRQWVVVKTELPINKNKEEVTMEDFIKLKKEIASMKEENEILKKALTIFVKK